MFESDFHSEYTSITNAQESPMCEISEYPDGTARIFYSDESEEEFLEGTETTTYSRQGTFLDFTVEEQDLELELRRHGESRNRAGRWLGYFY